MPLVTCSTGAISKEAKDSNGFTVSYTATPLFAFDTLLSDEVIP